MRKFFFSCIIMVACVATQAASVVEISVADIQGRGKDAWSLATSRFL